MTRINITNDQMPGRMHDIKTVFVALLIAAALAVVADGVYFSDLEWKVRTSHLDGRLSDMERQAGEAAEDY